MRATRVPSALAPFALAALCSASTSDGDVIAPPGTVLVESERVKVGLDVDVAEELIAENEQLKGTLAAETPQHTVKIDDFFLMVTEVTNEQYAEFVAATGAKPPMTWGGAALDPARDAFLRKQHEERQKAREEGRAAPPRALFDPQGWWDDHWQDAEWKMPADVADHPVEYVDYQAALDYARWAGMRLPTEYEYQAAVRGRTERKYPWGDDWDDKKYAHSVHYGLDQTMPVGSFAEGATESGIHDLAGSLWEWTSSPFKAFPGYEPVEVEVGKGRQRRELVGLAPFDANQRVSVGGCYKTPKEALRVTVRRGTDRYQSTDALGFRCAATPEPGVDTADGVLKRDVPPSRRPVNVSYLPEKAVAIDRWQTRPGTSKVEGYSVVTAYDAVMFIPVEEVPAANKGNLDRLSNQTGIVHLGLLFTTEELLLPDLPAGTYFVAYRAEGETRQPDDGEEGVAAIEGYDSLVDTSVDNLVFLNVDGDFVAAIPCRGFDDGDLRDPRLRVELVREPEKPKPSAPPVVEMDVAVFNVPIQGPSSRRGFMVDLPLGLAPESVDGSWRRP